MSTVDCIIEVKRGAYLRAANTIVESIIREKNLQIGKDRRHQVSITVAKILRGQHTKLGTVDSGAKPDEILEEVCALGVLKAIALLHLPTDM